MKELLNQIKRLRVLVVGDVMLDRYVTGVVHRISPEAPVPVLTVGSERVVAGGAANVALNCASMGAHVEVCGWFGNDAQGDQLRDLLLNNKIEVDHSFRFSGIPTISKTRVTSGSQQICRVDRENSSSDYQPDLTKLTDVFAAKATQSDLVIISDYGKGQFRYNWESSLCSLMLSLLKIFEITKSSCEDMCRHFSWILLLLELLLLRLLLPQKR